MQPCPQFFGLKRKLLVLTAAQMPLIFTYPSSPALPRQMAADNALGPRPAGRHSRQSAPCADRFYFAVDCLARGCNGERGFAVAELASFYGRDSTVGQVLRRMPCSGACGGRVGAAWLATGPILNARVRPRRVPLLGQEARE